MAGNSIIYEVYVPLYDLLFRFLTEKSLTRTIKSVFDMLEMLHIEYFEISGTCNKKIVEIW